MSIVRGHVRYICVMAVLRNRAREWGKGSYDGRCGAVKRAADKMFAISWVVTVGPRPDDLWVIGKDNLETLAPPAPTGRSYHVFRQSPLDADIVSHLK